ncbi:hypothetical protein DQ238_07605 [Geodermatophilus sp. TF02-6]|uniref:hypothetical protein n=1 Tax=Geodermatophilus sp. TF02-6 TaxID=2250575 RepID=UPI000DE86036|nr:hypothetical protein [Geodermatophilus sp. TF02-6]RBY80897.1 hypothetical protein DQ238_07605 [Geodermatophilus sp. TF02-6]
MTAPSTAAPTGFTLRVPTSWVEFDVWRATRTGDLARLVDARITQEPELAPQRSTLLKLLRQTAADAERRGAVFCAAMTEAVDDAGVLAATAMVFQTEGAPDPADNTVEAIAAQVSAGAPADGSPTWRRVEVVELPVGRAVRISGVERVDLGARGSLDAVVMQTLIPVPHEQGVLDVVLTSPQVQLAEPMLELFDAISATLAWSSD